MATIQKVKSGYQKKTLGEVVDFIDGDRGTNYPSQGEFFPSGDCLFLSTKNVPNSKFSFEEKSFILAEKDAVLRKGKLQRGDYVLTTRGTVGNFAYYDNSVPHENIRINSGMVILRKKSDELDECFFRYYLSSASFSGQVNSRVSGSAQPQLPIRDMLTMSIDLPDLQTQSHIASILSAYDDLIENNEKRIKALEVIAQLLYTEWFVKFKFPGHKKAKMVDSGTEYGTIPEEWEVTRLDRIAGINTETFKKTEDSEIINYIDIASVSTGKIDVIQSMPFSEAPSRARRLVQHGDILWSTVRPNRKSYSLVINPVHNLVASTGFAVIRSIKIPYTYLYHSLTTENFVGYLVNHAQGAAYPAVKGEDFEKAMILLPSPVLLDKFHNLSVGLYNAKETLRRKNIYLQKMRDLLIPQLVTGKRILK